MKIAAIIAEYNPFHKGHKYHIQKTRELTGADAVAVIMSGNFVQRGECAVADKWIRAKAAVAAGADLVFELPTYYSLGVAQLFAFGAVATLDALGCTSYLSFGTESGTIDTLKFVAEKLVYEADKIEAATKKYLDNYTGYPAAREKAIASLYEIDPETFKTPNNMLAAEYLRALYQLSSGISPVCIKRIGGAYHDEDINQSFASATAIRSQLSLGGDISAAIPDEAYKIYESARTDGLFPVFAHDFDSMVLSRLRLSTPDTLKNILDMPHGFENRIISAAKSASTIDELIELCAARQYTHSRIRRLIFASFLGIENMGYSKKPTYVRVLAMNGMGKKALAKMHETATIPIITKTADYKDKDTDPLFLLDVRASDLYSLAHKNPANRRGGKDFTTSPIVVK